ncbi:MAG: LCP family protein [Bacteroidales bacterium]|nr:LCP family protein [Bacteroidales bacterium]
MPRRKTVPDETAAKYRKRKFWFWTAMVLLLLISVVIFFLIPYLTKDKEQKLIRVGICGEVHIPAVYTMASGADLSMLVRRAYGLTPNADIRRVNMDRLLMHDTIYHIPGRGNARAGADMQEALASAMKVNFKEVAANTTKGTDGKEIRQINVLYVGFPAVYMIINYYPDFKRISITHIPHTTLFLNNDYRLIDIFFTIGIDPTVKLLENRLNQRIDYYLIQDRFSFIDLIDMLDGIDLEIDKPYAEAYDLTPGPGHIDGFHTWEYIRFLDMKRIKRTFTRGTGKDLIRIDNFKAPPSEWQLAYEMRQHRQQVVMTSLRKAYALINPARQAEILTKITKTFETNIKPDLMLELYRDVLSTPSFSYGTLPGYYQNEGDKLYFYPDLPSFSLLRNQEIRTYLVKPSDKTQTTY